MGGRLGSRARHGAALVAAVLVAMAASSGPWAAGPAAAVSGIDMTLPTGHVISGRVTGPGGTPIPGIDAQAQGSIGSGGAISAADGTFAIRGLRDDTYQIQLIPSPRSVYLTHWYGAPTSSSDPTGAVDVVVHGADVAGIDQGLEVGARISGTVTGVAGALVAGIQVNALGGQSAVVAADGTYQIVGLFPGTYSLSIHTPPNSEYTAGVVENGVVINQVFGGSLVDASAGDVTGADVTLVRGVSISGRIGGGDGPVQVDASEVGGGFGFGSTVSTTGGDFAVHGLWPSSYTILFGVPSDPSDPFASSFPYGAYADGALVDQAAGVPVDVSSGADVTLSPVTIPPGAAMSGTIRGGATPLAGAYVYICDVNNLLGCVAVTTRADGTWRIGHFETGDWIVQVSAPHRVSGFYSTGGYVADRAAASPVHIDAAGPSVGGIDVSLPSGGSISGRITGPSGEPVAGAQMFASAGGGIGPGGAGNGTCSTGANGRYLCDGLPSDLYILGVNPVAPDPLHPGSPYLSGYYDAAAPGHYTADFAQKTLVMVIDPSDHTRPTAVSQTPSPGAVAVPRDTTVTVRFSEHVLGVSGKTFVLIDTRTGDTVGAMVTYDATGNTATLRPKTLLAVRTRYRASLTNDIKDWNGNRLVPSSWTFTTTADATPPKVVSRIPASHATNVPTASAMAAVFSEPVKGVDASTFLVVEKVTGLAVPGDVSYDEGTLTASFSTPSGLNSNTTYAITLTSGISDLAGNPLSQIIWTFKTGT